MLSYFLAALAVDCRGDRTGRARCGRCLEAAALLPYLVVFVAAVVFPFAEQYSAAAPWLCRCHAAVSLLREVRAAELLVAGGGLLDGPLHRLIQRVLPEC